MPSFDYDVAWIGRSCDHERSAITWAKSYPSARRAIADELELSWEEVIEVSRYPQLDGFTGDLLAWQFDNGWHWECSQCFRYATKDAGGVRRDERVFCCEACADKFSVEDAERRAKEAAAHERIQKRVAEMYPTATLRKAWVNGLGDDMADLEFPAPIGQRCVWLDADKPFDPNAEMSAYG